MSGQPQTLPALPPAPRKTPPVPGPKLLPNKATVARQVFLTEKMWEELKEAARFHSDLFKELKSSEGVSRNDLIDFFLEWALEAYWKEKGGKPTSKDDWDRKVIRAAEQVRAEWEQVAKKGSQK